MPSVRAPALEVFGLSVRYGSIEAVRQVSFCIGQNEVVALIGPNGAGKSSTANALVGLVRATGSVKLYGDPIEGLAADRMIRRGLSLVPEGRRVFPQLSVLENLVAGGVTRPPGERRESIEGVLALFPALRTRLKQQAGTLSGGEQQMLAIGRALMGSPKVLLLDEPSLGLAPKIVDEIFDLIGHLRERGLSLLVIEQNAERAISISDRTIVMVGGTIRHETASSEFRYADLAEKIHLGANP